MNETTKLVRNACKEEMLSQTAVKPQIDKNAGVGIVLKCVQKFNILLKINNEKN